MTGKIKLELISGLEELKSVVLDSFKYRDDISKIPHDLKTKYSEIYQSLIKNENYKNFPLLINILKADSLTYCIEVSHRTFNIFDNEDDEKKLWEDVFNHATSEINLIKDGNFSTVPHRIDGTLIGKVIESIKINKIQLSNFRFFIDDEKNNTFEVNGQNILIYGENGSGKSSLFKAFEYLSKISNTDISNEFKKDKNIFNLEKESFINFEFDNGETLEIIDDSDTNSDLVFINNLSVFMPMLEYKDILEISYETNKNNGTKNLYGFFEQILKEYPIGDSKVLRNLNEAQDERYFDILKKILNDELFDTINLFLEEFNQGFKIEKINFSAVYRTIRLDIDYFGEIKSNYHNFLNEARLSALAISIYFAIIKKQFSLLENNSLKILVLDDLLISLDMGNRLSLIKILKSEFCDYQVFFFTHDKALFEIFKDKMDNLKSYEIYVNDTKYDYEVPLIVKKETYLTRGREEFKNERYDCSANLLRKYSEELLFKYLPKKQRYSDTCNKLQLNVLFQKTLTFSQDTDKETNRLIKELQSFNKTLFNPQSHNDDRNLYKKELKDAIDVLEELKDRI